MTDEISQVLNPKVWDDAIFIALSRTFLKELVEATPGSGNLKQQWDLERVAPFQYRFFNPDGDIVLFLEEGTKPHIIKAKNKKALRWKEDGHIYFAKKVKHPGFEARRFVEGVF